MYILSDFDPFFLIKEFEDSQYLNEKSLQKSQQTVIILIFYTSNIAIGYTIALQLSWESSYPNSLGTRGQFSNIFRAFNGNEAGAHTSDLIKTSVFAKLNFLRPIRM